ncbi:MAG: hypothetical protein BroJett025_02790 [Patescibacteria group bacterium]|nr:MAG: hypothetical protein BroJett025_02790 [Patescibacteria group bacterium]
MSSLGNLELVLSTSISKFGKEETICRVHTALLACIHDGVMWDDPNFFEVINQILNKRLSNYVN